MTDRTPFSQDEWETIRSVPLLAGLAVARATPSGVRGGLGELRTLVVDIGRRASADPSSPVVDAIVDDHPRWHLSRLSGSDTADPEQLLADGVAACAAARSLLEARSPADVAHFREWVLSIAHRVARTCREQDDAEESPEEVEAITALRTALTGDAVSDA